VPNTATDSPRPVLVVDFGAQYAQLIARRVREARIYSEVIAHDAPIEEFQAKNPAALVLSGGPASVYAEDAATLNPAILELGVPVFGICYGFQAMAQALGGTVANTGGREFGRTMLACSGGILHGGLGETQPVWMSHNDAVRVAPDGFAVTGSTPGAPVAAFENPDAKMAGVQYHPEVLHSPHGQEVLSRTEADVDRGQHRRIPRRVGSRTDRRRRPGHLRPLRWCRLRGGGRPCAARHRRPADLCLRRSRPAARR
jgi:GMP synthase (glutamine-hydrolysing)